jgi:hypothetical protein
MPGSDFYDPEFAEYVDGRTIAVVGPAPSVGDQSAQVDAYDLVYRTSPQLGQASGYGDRCDLAYINSTGSGHARDGRWDDVFARYDWVVTKRHTVLKTVRHRKALLPPHGNANQITGMLWDLAQYDPADVAVFGADFYTTTRPYDPGYHGGQQSADQHAAGVRLHDQRLQRRNILNVLDRKGWPSGDLRFNLLLEASDEEFELLLAHWYQPRNTLREYAATT